MSVSIMCVCEAVARKGADSLSDFEGLTNKEVAERLGVSVNTVRTHRARLMEKLDLHTTGELVRYAIDRGLVS